MLWDYIVVGGGLSGSVVSNRLLESNSSLKILVVEAGPNANDDPRIVWTNSTNMGIGGVYDWNLTSVAQANLNGRTVGLPHAKALGGGTVINGGGWTRGDKYDYDLWGHTVGDDRWTYAGQLPYMKKTETFPNASVNPTEHGFDGKIYVQNVISTHRDYPLRETVLKSFKQIGIEAAPLLDANAGHPQAVGNYAENKHNGRREVASAVYSLDGITVLTVTMVEKVLVSKSLHTTQATGIRLANGTDINGKEIILSAGAIFTPQLLKLSGIGPADELSKFNIPVKVDAPEVGKNFVDHGLAMAYWKLKDPAAGYSVTSGNPLFKQEQFNFGNPVDFITSATVPKEGLAAAIKADEGVAPDETHPLLQNRTFFEHVVLYKGKTTDGSDIATSGASLLPTSRGTVKLASANVSDAPLVNPNWLDTEVDRYVFREGLRQQIALLHGNKTDLGTRIIDSEEAPSGFDVGYSETSTDDYLDARARAGVGSCYHPMGSAAMGKVVDTDLRVKGVKGLRVVDASVFPVVITAHLQVAVYAMAEQAAMIIARGN